MESDFRKKILLGRTELSVSRLGIAHGYGPESSSIEKAFHEYGVNYFVMGERKNKGMVQAIKNLSPNHREDLVIAVLSYAHSAFLTERFFMRGLRDLGIEYTDVLILGYFPRRPSQRVIDGALRLKDKGMTRFIGLTSHNRKVFPELHKEGLFDCFHIRYSAAHRGAEQETFPYLKGKDRPGVVSFTATAWKRLLNPKKMPPGETPPSAVDCYRFVLSNPAVDVCMMGARSIEQMRENLKVLNQGPMTKTELARMQKIGDYVY